MYHVIEIFASIDGEGLRSGQTAQFVRLAHCNLSCSYCDTRYAWDATSEPIKSQSMSAADIVATLRPDIKNVTLTGGEPLLGCGAYKLVKAIVDAGFYLNIETNGAVDIAQFRPLLTGKSFFTLDYKLPSSGMEKNMLMANYQHLRSSDVVKFVVGSDNDVPSMLRTIEYMHKHCAEMPHIYVGVVWGQYNAQRLVQLMLTEPLLSDCTLQLQIHKFIWNPNERGV